MGLVSMLLKMRVPMAQRNSGRILNAPAMTNMTTLSGSLLAHFAYLSWYGTMLSMKVKYKLKKAESIMPMRSVWRRLLVQFQRSSIHSLSRLKLWVVIMVGENSDE